MSLRKMVENEAKKEAQKKSLLDEYGVFWAITGNIVGRWILGVFGAAADSIVVGGIMYLAFHNLVISAIVGIVIAAIVQIVSGDSLMKVTKGFHKKKWSDIKFRRQMIILSVLYFGMFGLSIYFSLNTDKPVEAKGEISMKGEIKDETPIKEFYQTERKRINDLYQGKISVLQSEADALRSDKAHDSQGKLVVRWANLPAINKITSQEIPKIEAEHQKMLDTLASREYAEIALLRSDNRETKSKFGKWIKTTGLATKWVNVLFQVARCVILVGFMMFLVDTESELNLDSNLAPNLAPEPLPVNHDFRQSELEAKYQMRRFLDSGNLAQDKSLSFDRVKKPENLETVKTKESKPKTKTVYKTKIVDLTKSKKDCRNAWKAANKPKSKFETQKKNLDKYQSLRNQLEKHGFVVQEDSKSSLRIYKQDV